MQISKLYYRQISKNDYPVMGRALNIFFGMFGALFLLKKGGIHSCDGGCLLTYIWYIDGGEWWFYN